jgi:hypothetical protein
MQQFLYDDKVHTRLLKNDMSLKVNVQCVYEILPPPVESHSIIRHNSWARRRLLSISTVPATRGSLEFQWARDDKHVDAEFLTRRTYFLGTHTLISHDRSCEDVGGLP